MVGEHSGSGDIGGLIGEDKVAPAYKVLARKYRPSSFQDLIGQEPMVRTLTNAFALHRIHQAYILTGVRGVGKTTTARILARAFNYQLPGQPSRPSVEMPVIGVHCQAIIESRHVDVIEMDAASHTGIDDVREIIENARYLPVMAAKKIYIIDEVHMLSKQAFNGLLKTLEEPPEHVKFLFATTEIDKVPITVRSRCQRFDLRRIENSVMVSHLAAICVKERISVEHEALAMIARASEGSVRDALSLLDQAIAHGAGPEGIRAEILRSMLGLADRGRIIDLFEAVMRGEIAVALAGLKDQNDNGADPGQILMELAEFVHFVTRLKLVPGSAADPAIPQIERERGLSFAQQLTLPVLTRAWQILAKGLEELKDSPRPLASADMVLVRLCFAADLPLPEDVLRRIPALPQGNLAPSGLPKGGPSGSVARLAVNSGTSVAAHAIPARAVTAAPVLLGAFQDVISLAASHRDIQLKTSLECDVHLIKFEQGIIEFSLADGASPQVAQNLMRRLQEWTGQRWIVVVSSALEGALTLRQQTQAREGTRRSGIASHPLVRSVMEHFPGARIIAMRLPENGGLTEELESAGGSSQTTVEDIGYSDNFSNDDDF